MIYFNVQGSWWINAPNQYRDSFHGFPLNKIPSGWEETQLLHLDDLDELVRTDLKVVVEEVLRELSVMEGVEKVRKNPRPHTLEIFVENSSNLKGYIPFHCRNLELTIEEGSLVAREVMKGQSYKDENGKRQSGFSGVVLEVRFPLIT